MQKIIPFLWFERDIKSIISYYSFIFPNVTVSNVHEISGTPSGTVENASLTIYNQRFDIMTAGPYLPFNPTISFIILCESEAEANMLWDKFLPESKVLMDKNAYPFAEVYGWLSDKYGVSWQIFYSSKEKVVQKIVPAFMFAGDACGRAEEALDFYTKNFKNSALNYRFTYADVPSDEPIEDTRAKINHAGFVIERQGFALFDSAKKSPLTFDQAISFMVMCENQEEIDYYWDILTKNGGKEVQCGWCTDKFGIPWQVVPTRMTEMLSTGTPKQIKNVTEAFMKMKKFDLKTLEEAFEGK